VALMLYTLRGTPFIYQGEELGLPDADIPPERVVDVDGRDPERAPIPWRPPSEVGEGAGFTTAKPWLPLVADAEHLCVERQAADPRSMLTLVRRLAAVRARTPVLHSGAQRTVDAGADVFAWLREGEGERLLAAMNFATDAVPFRPLTDMPRRAALVLSSDPDRADREVDPNGFVLRPSEAVLLRLKEEA
jgi:alpha-glucosidase